MLPWSLSSWLSHIGWSCVACTQTYPFKWPRQEVRSTPLTPMEFFYSHALHTEESSGLRWGLHKTPRFLLSGAQPDCSADIFEKSWELRELPMVICRAKCPKIADASQSALKERRFSTAGNLECSQFYKCFLDAADGDFVHQLARLCFLWWLCLIHFELSLIIIWSKNTCILVTQGGWVIVLVLLIRSLLVESNRNPSFHWLKQWRELNPLKKARGGSGCR